MATEDHEESDLLIIQKQAPGMNLNQLVLGSNQTSLSMHIDQVNQISQDAATPIFLRLVGHMQVTKA